MQKKMPQRMCVACREMKAKKELIRLVRTPEGQLVQDPIGKKTGRGAYICHTKSCLNKAQKSRAIERALNMKVDEAMWQELQAGLAQGAAGEPHKT